MDSDGSYLTPCLCKTLCEVFGYLLFQEQKDIYLQMQGDKFQVRLVLENGRVIAGFKPLDFLLNLPRSNSSRTLPVYVKTHTSMHNLSIPREYTLPPHTNHIPYTPTSGHKCIFLDQYFNDLGDFF